MRVLLLSTPVAPLGSGPDGGVGRLVESMVRGLSARGHTVTVLAPRGSRLPGIRLRTVAGQAQPSAQHLPRDAAVCMPSDAVLANLWEHARTLQDDADVLLNVAYDWLPLYLTPFLRRPVAHFLTMASLSNALDGAAARVAHLAPGSLGVHSRAQAATFPFARACRVLGAGLDLAAYRYQPGPGEGLAWVGRVAPEKGLEDAVRAAGRAGLPLQVMGHIQDSAAWQAARAADPRARVQHLGFLDRRRLQAALGRCRALLVTPRWVEAMGLAGAEALACGVPVIAYRGGGPGELVRHGETGWLVEPGSVDGLVAAIGELDRIDRRACRRQAETDFSLDAWGARLEAWLRDVVAATAARAR